MKKQFSMLFGKAQFKPLFFSLIALLTLVLSGCNSLSPLLFFPQKPYLQLPEQLGLKAEYVNIKTHDGEILANWYLKSHVEPKGNILFLHGNGENISTHINSVAWLPQQGYHVFLLDYRGYGQSTGVSSLRSALSDIEDAHKWLTHKETNLPLIVLGQSLGGALAITYTANYDQNLNSIAALASESAPASWPQVSREAMSKHWLTWPLTIPALFMTAEYDAERHIQKIKDIPILLLHSQTDPIVSVDHGRQLYDKSQGHAQWLEYNGPHIAGFLHATVRQQFLDFLDNSLRKK
jgi:alpha-beta hydrolase superfamily lysophospholipase